MADQATMPRDTGTARRVTRRYPGRPEQVAAVRALVAGLLRGHPAADDAVLLASELAANAVAHSASGRPGGRFTVRVETDRDGPVRVEVEDEGSAWTGDLSAARPPHGLFLLLALSAACGVRRGDRGWTTWFTVTADHRSGESSSPDRWSVC